MSITIGQSSVEIEKNQAYLLKLYVAGATPKCVKAFANLHNICETYLAGKYSIEIIDLTKNPQFGRSDQIIAIPTLIRKLPRPLVKIIGDLSNTERVLVRLSIQPKWR